MEKFDVSPSYLDQKKMVMENPSMIQNKYMSDMKWTFKMSTPLKFSLLNQLVNHCVTFSGLRAQDGFSPYSVEFRLEKFSDGKIQGSSHYPR